MKTIPLLLAALSGLALAAEPPAVETPPKGLASSDWSSIRAAYEAGRHAIQRQENGTFTARNPGQQWHTEFDGKGFLTTPDHGQWTWGLELIGYGERTLLSAHSGSGDKSVPAPYCEVGKISCQRDAHLTEWFINDTRGLEQGWTIQSKPTPTTENLALTLAIRGTLHPQVSPDSSSVAFQTPSGSTALTYGGLKAWDADGTKLPVRFEPAGETAIRIAVEDQDARYPITIDPIAQQAYLKASNTGAEDGFGQSVAVSGDTVVIGASSEDSSTTGINSTPNENADSSGAAYVFTRNGTTWSQQAYLKASNTGEFDKFGVSVAVSGDTVVVGANGENSTPDESAIDSGAAYVFTRSGTTWSQQAYLKASNTGASDLFGISVAVSGDTVVVGASGEDSSTTGVDSTPNENATDSGAAYVFARSGTTWSQQAYLKASNTGPDDRFGRSVAVSGDTVVVGADGEGIYTTWMNSTPNESASYSGAAYVFTRSGTTWSQQAYLKASNTEPFNYFGVSVAVSGNTVVVGANGEDSSTTGVNSTPTPDESANSSGAAYVFTRSGAIWSQQAYLKASNAGRFDFFGGSVAVSGDTVIVGAGREGSSTVGVNSTPNESAVASGAAYVFTRSGTIWNQQAYLKASNTGANDSFGISVAVSGDTVVVGATGEDSSTAGVNSTPNESAGSSGAAYIFSGFDLSSQTPYLAQANSSAITGNSATLGGTVTSQGGTAVSGRGVVYSLVSANPDPAIGGAGVTQLATSGTTGTFTASATGLTPSSTYAFRAYATNSNGTTYTSVAIFKTPPYFLTTSASNGTIQRSPNLADYAPGSVVTLTAVPAGGAVFQGWTGDLSGTANPTTITMDGNKTVTATFLLSLAGALDTSGLTYTLGGDANWFPQTITTVDGADAAQSGAIGHREQTWFEITVTGPGSLSFRWKVSSESGYDFLEFYMDGVLQPGRISGEVDWASQSYNITAGSHTLRWRYAKDEIEASGSDAGWVDQLVWAPSGGYQAAAGAAGLSENNALPTATPYNDGVKNLLKYAFNMNLSGPDSRALVSGTGNAGLPAIGLTGTGPATMIRVEFLRRKGSGLVYTAKRSSTLSPGSFVAMSGTPVVTSIDDNWERVVVQESADPATLPKSFAMVEVGLP
jgi:trimeric autotransporter adhesin